MRLIFLLLSLLVPLLAAGEGRGNLAQQFATPPRQARPWVYWVWLRVDTTPEALTRDLEEMKDKGIAGCILYDAGAGNLGHVTKKVVLEGKEYRVVPTDDFKGSRSTRIPGARLTAWSPRWRELVRFAAKTAGRLGLDFVVANGLANTSGHIPEAYGEQKLIWNVTSLQGPQEYSQIENESSVAVLAVPDHPGIDPKDTVNLTGKPNWSAPAGRWKIIRFSQAPTGARNDWGYYTDSMSTVALDKTWEVTMAPLLAEMTPEERNGLKGIEDDSWEAGPTTWTKTFPAEFKRRRGYDLIPYLPILSGVAMGDAATQARIVRDYKLTISDLIADNHYGHLRQLAHENGLTCYAEAAGPNYTQADLLKTSSEVDMAMAEFWMPSYHRPLMKDRFLVRNAANANHVYGKPITMCEAFTSIGPSWEETPFTMKPVADQAFCDGLNRVCIHAFSQSPSLTAKPGYVYFAGTHYDRSVTWWDETPAFNLYLARCSAMLQAGKFVADVIFYQGDNIGRAEPRKTIPPALGDGYDHDNCNSDVILNRMSVRDGRIVLPDGMSYRLLVLPEGVPVPPEVRDKIAALIKAGATVVAPPLSVRQVLGDKGIPPDFEESGLSEAGTLDWIHRKLDDIDIYYLASRWAPAEKVDCTFRVSGKQPELWNPVTGQRRDATVFRQENGRTLVPLEFDPHGSVFVVFQKPIAADINGKKISNYPMTHPLSTLAGPWTIHFDPKWGGPETVTFDTLADWTTRPEPGIKFYSGTAIYQKGFALESLPQPGMRLLLDLGEVHEIARVRLNGLDLGVLWTKPAQVDITDAVKRGNNSLEITVVNLWPNRLIGDAALPKDERLTESNIHKFGPASPLLPSGLIGPVTVQEMDAP